MQAVTQYQVGAAAVERIQEAQRLPVEDLADATPSGSAPDWEAGWEPEWEAGPASVAFERVRFRYRPELTEVHDDVSFQCRPAA